MTVAKQQSNTNTTVFAKISTNWTIRSWAPLKSAISSIPIQLCSAKKTWLGSPITLECRTYFSTASKNQVSCTTSSKQEWLSAKESVALNKRSVETLKIATLSWQWTQLSNLALFLLLNQASTKLYKSISISLRLSDPKFGKNKLTNHFYFKNRSCKISRQVLYTTIPNCLCSLKQRSTQLKALRVQKSHRDYLRNAQTTECRLINNLHLLCPRGTQWVLMVSTNLCLISWCNRKRAPKDSSIQKTLKITSLLWRLKALWSILKIASTLKTCYSRPTELYHRWTIRSLFSASEGTEKVAEIAFQNQLQPLREVGNTEEQRHSTHDWSLRKKCL